MAEKIDYEEIKEFVLGRLSAAKEADLKKRMETDDELAREVALYQDITEVSEVLGDEDLRELISLSDQELEAEQFFAPAAEQKEVRPQTGSARVFTLRRALAAAAAILVLIASWWVIQNALGTTTTREQIYAANFTTPPLESIVVPGVNKGEDLTDSATAPSETFQLWESALAAFQQGDRPEALNIIGQINGDELDPVVRGEYHLLAGILHMEAGQYEQAEGFLNRSEQANPLAVEWYRALLLLQQDRPVDELSAAFSAIAGNQLHPWREEAAGVLDQLARLQE